LRRGSPPQTSAHFSPVGFDANRRSSSRVTSHRLTPDTSCRPGAEFVALQLTRYGRYIVLLSVSAGRFTAQAEWSTSDCRQQCISGSDHRQRHRHVVDRRANSTSRPRTCRARSSFVGHLSYVHSASSSVITRSHGSARVL